MLALVNLVTHLPFTDVPVLRDYQLGPLRQEYDYVIGKRTNPRSQSHDVRLSTG